MKNIPWKTAAAGVAAVFMLTTVVRAVTAQPSTQPDARDIQGGARIERPPAGRTDPRDEVPRGDLIAGNGVVEPADRETRVAAAVSGRLARVAVREGDHVHAGDLLAELASEPEQAAQAAAEAEVAVASAELARARRGTRAEDVDAANAEAEAARARAALSTDLLARSTALARTGDATQDELDRARRQSEADQATVRQLDARRRLAVNGTRREDIDVAAARVRAAAARRDQARANVDRLSVRSPIEAEVLFVRCRAGEYYVPGSEALMILGDTRTLRARLDIDEREIARVRVGAAAFVTADAFPGRRLAGRVADVARRFGRRNVRTDDPSERIDTKVLEVVVELTQRDGLVPGQRVVGYLSP